MKPRMIAGADKPSLTQAGRRVVLNRSADPLHDVERASEARGQIAQFLAARTGERGGDVRQPKQRIAQGHQVAGVGQPGSSTTYKALDVSHPSQQVAQVSSANGVTCQLLHSLLAPLNAPHI